MHMDHTFLNLHSRYMAAVLCSYVLPIIKLLAFRFLHFSHIALEIMSNDTQKREKKRTRDEGRTINNLISLEYKREHSPCFLWSALPFSITAGFREDFDSV